MKRLLEVIERAAALTDSVIVSFSCGKDSAVLLDLCSRYFKRVEAFHMYIVPGLSFHETYMRMMEQRYEVKIRRVPSWLLSQMLANASLRPHTSLGRSTPKLKLPDIWHHVQKATGIDWIADGSKAADSFTRRQMLIGWKGIYQKEAVAGGRIYPLTQWSNKTVAAYMTARRIPLSPEYRFLDHSFSSLEAAQLVEIEKHFPDDYQKIKKQFPQCEAIVARERWRQQREPAATEHAGSGGEGGKRHPMDRWPIEPVPRSKIKAAAYNPRTITKNARRTLAKGLDKFGLADVLVWNRRSRNLVGGHQRLDALDEQARKEKLGDYTVDCKVVDLSETDEKALNVLLNNPHAAGEFDMTALESLIGSGMDYHDAGFSELDMKLLFGDGDRLASMFEEGDDPAAADIEHIKKVKQEVRDSKAKHVTHDDDAEFYTVIVADSREKLDAFLTRFGLPIEQRYQSLEQLLAAIDEQSKGSLALIA